jgi:hypothetical protein
MSICNLNKNDLLDKYINFLKIICYSNDKNICYNFSIDFNAICQSCVINNIKIIDINDLKKNYCVLEQKICDTIKDLLYKCKTCCEKKDNETTIDYKIKIMLELFKTLYYNPMFFTLSPQFLITIINKINELLCEDYDKINDYIKINKEYQFVFDFMILINKYTKNYVDSDNNKLSYTFDINLDIFTKFLDDFTKMLYKNYVEKINNYYKNYEIDINKIENLSIILEL